MHVQTVIQNTHSKIRIAKGKILTLKHMLIKMQIKS